MGLPGREKSVALNESTSRIRDLAAAARFSGTGKVSGDSYAERLDNNPSEMSFAHTAGLDREKCGYHF